MLAQICFLMAPRCTWYLHAPSLPSVTHKLLGKCIKRIASTVNTYTMPDTHKCGSDYLIIDNPHACALCAVRVIVLLVHTCMSVNALKQHTLNMKPAVKEEYLITYGTMFQSQGTNSCTYFV